MASRGLSSSPLARLLMELAGRGADGTIRIGGRTLVLRRGMVVDVLGSEHDEPLEDFMVHAGRLSAEQAQEVRKALSAGVSHEAALRTMRVPEAAIRTTRRAMMLDRLVRGLAVEEESAEGLPAFEPDATVDAEGYAEPMPPLLLDALERRAGENDAGLVGERASAYLHWAEGPHLDTARRWSALGDDVDGAHVYECLKRSPAAASRIAALIRAGLMVLQPDRHSAPPPPRPLSVAPPPPRPNSAPPPPVTVESAQEAGIHVTPPSSTPSSPPPSHRVPASAPRFRDTLRPGSPQPPREPVRRLDPGESAVDASDFDVAGDLPELPPAGSPWTDPLDEAERRIASLEQTQASGPERAEAWLAYARLWLRHHRSLEEAARASREAAAADPQSLAALRESAALCASVGKLDLARAYARAAARMATDGLHRAECLLEAARLEARGGDAEAARTAVEAAAEANPDSPSAFELLARLRASHGDTEGAVAAALRAAELRLDHQPEVARAWAEMVLDVVPAHPVAIELEGRAALALGHGAAAGVFVAHRARRVADPETRSRLLATAAEAAERGSRIDLAMAFHLEAFESSATPVSFSETLAAYAETCVDPSQRALLLEAAARVAPPDRAAALLAEASAAVDQASAGSAWALELLGRALALAPGDDALAARHRRLAEHARDLSLHADALERAIRAAAGGMADGVERRMQELAVLAEIDLAAPHLSTWALARLESRLRNRLDGADEHTRRALEGMVAEVRARAETLRAKTDIGFGLLQMAETDVRGADDTSRPTAERKLAGLLREHPEERERAIALADAVLSADPSDAATALAIDRLLSRIGDDQGRVALALRRIESATSDSERLRYADLLMGLSAWTAQPDVTRYAAAVVTTLAPERRDATLRLELAARALGDAENLRFALERLVAEATTVGEQAAVLARRARLESSLGDAATAVYYADTAFTNDPACLEALPILLDHVDALTPARAAEIVEAARSVVGDTPGLLGLGLHLARERGDTATAKALVEARCRIGDDPVAIAPLRLRQAIDDQDVQAVLLAAEQALAPPALSDQTADLVERALEVLGHGDPVDAATVALLAVDRLGDGRFVAAAHRYAEQSGLFERRVAAIERAIAWTEGASRATNLRALAAMYAEAKEPAREARTYLRLLAEVPEAADAWDRLSHLYAEAREPERLLAVLALRLEAASTPEARALRLLHLALAALVVARDPERAEGFLRRLVSEAAEPERVVHRAAAALVRWGAPARAVVFLRAYAAEAAPGPSASLYEHAVHIAETHLGDPKAALDLAREGLDRAPGSPALLVAFERAALVTADVQAAVDTYATLREKALGDHGRRGIRYREARWLERAGQAQSALDAYVACFRLSPSDGVVFQAIERLSASLGRWNDLVDALLALVEIATHVDRRMALLHNTAALCEGPLDDPGRAFDLLFEAWRSTGRSELLGDVRRLARRLRERDATRSDAALAEVVEVLGNRVDMSWDADDQIRCLRILASVEWEDRHELGSAIAHVDRGVKIALENDDADRVEAAELQCDAARYLLDSGNREDAQARIEGALALVADHERALALRNEAMALAQPRDTLRSPHPSVPHSVRPKSAVPTIPTPPHPLVANAGAAASGIRRDTLTDSWIDVGGAKKPEVRPSVPTDDHERELSARAARGDAEALGEWASLLAATPGREAEAVRVLRSLLRTDPTRTTAWRTLASLAERTGRLALGAVAGAVVSSFDPSHPAPDETRATRLASVLGGELATLVRDPHEEAVLELLELAWQGGMPLFRRTLASFGLVGTQQVPPLSSRPLARTHADLVLVLGRAEIPLYLHEGIERDVAVLPTQPPSIVVRENLEKEVELLRFRLARAMSLASPSGVLVAAQEEARARVLVEALHAAFGSPDQTGPVGREAAALAAELWHTVPARHQARMRDAMVRLAVPFTWPVVKAIVEGLAARVGLVAAGRVQDALRGLAMDDDAVAAHDLGSEDRFREAAKASPGLASVLRFVLSDDYLAARERVVSSDAEPVRRED